MNIRHAGRIAGRIALASNMLLAACGESLSGTYNDQTGQVQLTFRSGSKVTLAQRTAQAVQLHHRERQGDREQQRRHRGDLPDRGPWLPAQPAAYRTVQAEVVLTLAR